ncbi:hypothetical protein [Paracoccus sp. T5]
MFHFSALSVVTALPMPLRKLVTRRLYRRLTPRLLLDGRDVAGRRVLILGPARTVAQDLAAIEPGRYDLIVRMNNGLDTPVPALGADRLRCDMLFHSLTPDARPVTREKLAQAGVRMLVHRTPTQGAFLRTVIASRQLAPQVQVRCLPLLRYQALSAALGGCSPTTGLVAADFFLEAPIAELAVVGCTFFQTCYCPGYDPAVPDDAAARLRIADAAHHAPRQEAALFAERVRAARLRGLKVVLGPDVLAVLEGMGHSL